MKVNSKYSENVLFSYFFMFVSVAMLVVRYLLGEEKPVLAL